MKGCLPALLVGSLALGGCTPEPTLDRQPMVNGLVRNEAGTPLANVNVTVVSATDSASAVSNPNGGYVVHYSGHAGEYVSVQFSAPGYAPAARRAQMQPATSAFTNTYVEVVLRPVDQVVDFALPTGSQTVSFSLNRNGASAQLTLPGDALVDPNGTVVQGGAVMSLTMWSPADDMTTAPGVLRASGRNGDPLDANPIQLISYGMVDIDVRQGDTKLQVAPGKALALLIQTTAARRDAIAARPASVKSWPSLWTLNPNTGLWDEDVGDSTFDVTTGELNATLRHLSTKNADEPFTDAGPSAGNSGCFKGRVLGGCGQPIAGATVKINIESGTTSAVNATFVTDANGMYSTNWTPSGHNTYFHQATWSGHTTDMTQSPKDPLFQFEPRPPIPGMNPTDPRAIFVAMTCSDVSGVCQNPTCACFNDPTDPGGCMEALEAGDPNTIDGYNPCWQDPLGAGWAGPCFDDILTGGPVDLHFNTVWKNWAVGDLCQNCWPLLDLVFKDVIGDQTVGCTGLGATGTGCCPAVPPVGSYNVCDDPTATNRKFLGDACQTGVDMCCPQGSDGPLECNDSLCVPVADPTAVQP